ncbi:hypothetical protein ACHAWF_009809 [Thalassiosira exigua]
MIQMPEFNVENVSSKSYSVDRDSLCFMYFVWKRLMELVLKPGLPLPHAKKIIPSIVAFWNRCKGRIDEMTRHLDDMSFTFRRGTPKQVLIMRELKKLVLSVFLSKRHCFALKQPSTDQGFRAIQSHLWHLKISVHNVLHELATTYTIINPMTGIALEPLEPINEEIYNHLSLRSLSVLKKSHGSIVLSMLAQESMISLEYFIRLDKRLSHLPKSLGSYVDPKQPNASIARTATRSSSGSGKKKKTVTSTNKSLRDNKRTTSGGEIESGNTSVRRNTCSMNPQLDNGADVYSPPKKRSRPVEVGDEKDDKGKTTADVGAQKKKRISVSRCVLCIALTSIPEEKKKVSRSVNYCQTCLVHLCTSLKPRQKYSCFERWHAVKNLDTLLRNQILTPK